MAERPSQRNSGQRQVQFQRAAIFSALGAFGLALLFLILTGETWRAVAYAMAALFVALVGLAVYFWGTMVFGGLIEAFRRRETPVPWSFEEGIGLDSVPEHDIDPGLELLAAGMLVYRVGEVKPRLHFRQVPLADMRAMRPFVVARTGEARTYPFRFVLEDERTQTRFEQVVDFPLVSAPQLVTTDTLLVPRMPKRLMGQRWRLRVTTGVTVVTTFGFMFVSGQDRAADTQPSVNGRVVSEAAWTFKDGLLPHLVDESLKRDALTSLKEIVLEDL